MTIDDDDAMALGGQGWNKVFTLSLTGRGFHYRKSNNGPSGADRHQWFPGISKEPEENVFQTGGRLFVTTGITAFDLVMKRTFCTTRMW